MIADADLIFTDGPDGIWILQEIVHHVRTGRGSAVHRNAARICLRIDSCILERLVCGLKEDSMLWIGCFCFARIEAEELRVKLVNIFEQAPGLYIIGLAKNYWIYSRC